MLKQYRENIFFGILLLLLLIIYASGLFIDVTRDAAKYAYISKEIIQTKNWIDLQVLGEPYNQKPHLMFWLSSISYLLFGISNLSFKLPIILYTIPGLYFTYQLGKSTYSKSVGKMAGIMLAFSVIIILYNQDLHTDTVLFTNSALALWQLYEYLKFGRSKNLFLSGIALGLCLLSKGPFGVIVPLLTVLGYLVAQRKWKELLTIKWLLIVAIAFLTASPVFYQLYKNWGIEGFSFFFFGNTVGRFTGSYLGHFSDPTFYFHNLLYLLLPWSILFFASIISHTKLALKKNLQAPDHFIYWGFILFFIISSLSNSQSPNYFMGAVPLIAIFISNYWINQFDVSKLAIKLQGYSNYIIWGIAFGSIFYFSKEYTIVKLLAFATALIASQLVTKNFTTKTKLLYRSYATAIAAGALLNFIILPVLFGYQAQTQAAGFLNKKTDENICVVTYQKSQNIFLKRLWENPDTTLIEHFNQTPAEKHFSYNYELMFYSKHPVKHIETESELEVVLRNRNIWFYTDTEGKEDLENKLIPIDTIIRYNHFSLKNTAKIFTSPSDSFPFQNKYLIHTK